MPVYESITELIGNTPLIKIYKSEKANIFAKLEYFNPAGSIKDRVALSMLLDALNKGEISKGGTVIEPTSGNTGIGIAAVAVCLGLKAIIVMPDSMSIERIKLMTAYGAEVVLTEGKLGMTGAIKKAEEIKKNTPNSIIAGQFVNPSNVSAHYNFTGPEIWKDTQGKVDIFVAGVGTGGTLTGVGKYLKEKKPHIKVIAVEPSDSPLLSGGKAGSHKLQGIGANFIPGILDKSIIDEVITVSTEEAYSAARNLAKEEAILCGISSGAALCGAIALAKRQKNKGKNIVVILPDTGSRYLSTDLF